MAENTQTTRGALTMKNSRAAGWTRTNKLWQSLDPHERVAAMALMEVNNSKDVESARDVAAAIVNRSQQRGLDLGQHVSSRTYQPTFEPSQQRRLASLVGSPQFGEVRDWARRYSAGEEADPVNGATHYLAHAPAMYKLSQKNPQKYPVSHWGDWAGFDPSVMDYRNKLHEDASHSFLAPDPVGRYSVPRAVAKAAPAQAAPAQAVAVEDIDKPRRVQTMTMRPDGTFVDGPMQSPGPAIAPAPAAPVAPSPSVPVTSPFNAFGTVDPAMMAVNEPQLATRGVVAAQSPASASAASPVQTASMSPVGEPFPPLPGLPSEPEAAVAAITPHPEEATQAAAPPVATAPIQTAQSAAPAASPFDNALDDFNGHVSTLKERYGQSDITPQQTAEFMPDARPSAPTATSAGPSAPQQSNTGGGGVDPRLAMLMLAMNNKPAQATPAATGAMPDYAHPVGATNTANMLQLMMAGRKRHNALALLSGVTQEPQGA
jgi:hypothetical protein